MRPAVCWSVPGQHHAKGDLDGHVKERPPPTYRNIPLSHGVPSHWVVVHTEGSTMHNSDRIFGELQDFMSRFLYAAFLRCLNTGICRARQSLTLFPPTLAKPWFRLENAKTTELFWPLIQGMLDVFDMNGRVLQYKKMLTGCSRVRVGWAYAVGAGTTCQTVPERGISTTIVPKKTTANAKPRSADFFLHRRSGETSAKRVPGEASPTLEEPLDETAVPEPIGILYETHCASAHLVTCTLHLFGKDVPRVPGLPEASEKTSPASPDDNKDLDLDLMFVDHTVFNTLSFAGVEFSRHRDDFGEGESTDCDDSYFLGLDHRA